MSEEQIHHKLDEYDDELSIKSSPESIVDMDMERREILSRLGKMSALTAPGVVTLMMSKRASAGS